MKKLTLLIVAGGMMMIPSCGSNYPGKPAVDGVNQVGQFAHSVNSIRSFF